MVAVGRKQAANPLDRAALQVLDDASRNACDAMDGVRDGVINDPRLCAVDVDALVCAAGESEGCLSAGQAETARFIYGDMHDAEGNLLSPGVPPGAEAAGDWGGWILPNETLAGGDTIVGDLIPEMLTFLMRHDPTFELATFDPVADHDRLTDPLTPLDLRTADLSEFRDRGGKLLIYQGWNDFPLRPQRAIAYLEEVEEAMDGPAATADFLPHVHGARHGALRGDRARGRRTTRTHRQVARGRRSPRAHRGHASRTDGPRPSRC